MSMNEVRFRVDGYPPGKNEARSMLAPGHPHAHRVRALLEAARTTIASSSFRPFEGPIGLDVVVHAVAGRDPWDATNYLGGIGDVLEVKSRRGALDHLGDLGTVAIYRNDRQIQEVHYQQLAASSTSYEVRIYRLDV
jgi:hypothetical protein